MTHMAMSSIRVMATCALLGEAVGKAAAVAVRNGIAPHEVYLEHMKQVQTLLLNEDCFLPSRTDRSPKSAGTPPSLERMTPSETARTGRMKSTIRRAPRPLVRFRQERKSVTAFRKPFCPVCISCSTAT